MEQPAFALIRMEKVMDARASLEQKQINKQEAEARLGNQ